MTRNFEHVQFAGPRTEIIAGKPFDQHFNELHDALEIAYYGVPIPESNPVSRDPNTGWRNGFSADWHGHDKQATPEESKALFDKLHGLIFQHRDVLFHALNEKKPLAKRVKREKYDAQEVDENGAVTVWKSEFARLSIDALKLAGVEIPQPVSV